MADAPTSDLLARLSAGRDSVAWSALVERHAEGMRRAAQAAGGADLADDAVQEALLQVRDRAGRFVPPAEGDPERAATGWLRAVAVNCALVLARSARRRDRHQRPMEVAAMADARSRDPAAAMVAAEERRSLALALADLPDRDRAPILLRFYAGIEGKDELGAALGCSGNAAGVRLHRAMERLREHLAASGCVLAVTALGTALASAAEVPAPPVAASLARWSALIDQPVAPALPAGSAFPHPGNLLMRLALCTAAVLVIATAVGVVAQAQDAPKPVTQPVAAPPPPAQPTQAVFDLAGVRGEPAFSPDGSWLALRTENELILVEVASALAGHAEMQRFAVGPQALVERGRVDRWLGPPGCFSPDGRQLLVRGPRSLEIIELAGKAWKEVPRTPRYNSFVPLMPLPSGWVVADIGGADTVEGNWKHKDQDDELRLRMGGGPVGPLHGGGFAADATWPATPPVKTATAIAGDDGLVYASNADGDLVRLDLEHGTAAVVFARAKAEEQLKTRLDRVVPVQIAANGRVLARTVPAWKDVPPGGPGAGGVSDRTTAVPDGESIWTLRIEAKADGVATVVDEEKGADSHWDTFAVGGDPTLERFFRLRVAITGATRHGQSAGGIPHVRMSAVAAGAGADGRDLGNLWPADWDGPQVDLLACDPAKGTGLVLVQSRRSLDVPFDGGGKQDERAQMMASAALSARYGRGCSINTKKQVATFMFDQWALFTADATVGSLVQAGPIHIEAVAGIAGATPVPGLVGGHALHAATATLAVVMTSPSGPLRAGDGGCVLLRLPGAAR